MTIAVQGDWGSGKTSVMEMLKHSQRLPKEDYWAIDFNTWQYSQFDLGDRLVFSLIGAILEGLRSKLPEEESGDDDKTAKTRRKIRRVAKTVAISAVRQSAGLVPYGQQLLQIADDAAKAHKEEDPSSRTEDDRLDMIDESVKLITSLRDELKSIISDVCGKNLGRVNGSFKAPKRIVVFIDDLDRLEPARAVAVMEAIKVFLDVPNCVFVLAIDFDVVLRGVREKYGDDFKEDKARAFFDKIIQVPFHLPVAAYSVKKLLQAGLKSVGVEVSDDAAEQYKRIALSSSGANPRSIKRLINTFGLIKKIRGVGSPASGAVGSGKESLRAKDLHVFTILCLQTSFPEVFSEIVRSFGNKTFDEALEKFFQERKPEDLAELGILDYRYERFKSFANEVTENFASDAQGKSITINEELFKLALADAAVTAVGTADVQGMAQSEAFRASPIADIKYRCAVWREAGYTSAIELGVAFEQGLTQVLRSVEAGVTKSDGYWSYEWVSEGKLQGKRYLELQPTKSKRVTLRFGKFIDAEAAEELCKEVEGEFPDSITYKQRVNYSPPFELHGITSPSMAETVGQRVAKLYTDHAGKLGS